MSNEKKIEILRKVPLFRGLNKDELMELFKRAKLKIFTKGETIFAEGEKGQIMYVIIKGKVRICTIIPGVGEEALAFYGPGEIIGEMALIEASKRSATVIAEEETETIGFKREKLIEFMQEFPAAGLNILWVLVRTLAERLRATNERLKPIFALAKTF
ncbi:MAG: hypothetical protein APR63_03335 [Desulfuromonas sp. SDB]|nr:MAG: hypothetical protein APR63_03335 [Desulfuromonas sp. SDB]